MLSSKFWDDLLRFSAENRKFHPSEQNQLFRKIIEHFSEK
jgi:hypothetical protein